MAHVCAVDLARDIAHLVLRRRVLVRHMSKLPGATAVLIRILLAGLLAGSQGASGTGDGESLVAVPGGPANSKAPLLVVRAGLQALCLSAMEGSAAPSGKAEHTREREELMRLLLPDDTCLTALGLPDEDTASMLQAPSARIFASAVASASQAQLVGALALCGTSAACLAAIVKRLKMSRDRPLAPLAATLRKGMGARAVALLHRDHTRESEWLANELGIKLATPLKLPALSPVSRASSRNIHIPAAETPSAAALTGSDAMHLERAAPASAPLLQVPAGTRLAKLVEAEASAAPGRADSSIR